VKGIQIVTKFADRERSALLVIDVQNDVVHDARKIVPELHTLAGEPIIRKLFRSSFEETFLDETLPRLGVGHLFISGAQTDYCVRYTWHAALELGYDITLVEDAHTTSDGAGHSGTLTAEKIVDEMNRSFQNYHLPDRSAKTMATGEVNF
jgi:nicotinamidase-related amidase